MIEHHVSHMSITDELLEEHMKRATLLVPLVPLFLLAQLLCFVVGLRGGQSLDLYTKSQVLFQLEAVLTSAFLP
jgi:hypothetical protein